MNPRYTLALALLLSTLPSVSFSNAKSDLAHCELDTRATMERLALNSDDVEAAVVYLFSEKLPSDWKCPFHLKEAIQREVILGRVDAHVTHGALALDVDVPSAGSVAVINNDESLHVLYSVATDLLAHKSSSDVLTNAGKTYVTEKLATAALWLVSKTNLEDLLPGSVTNGRVYKFFRDELARFGVTHAINKACTK